jgi:hypothetical protein
MGGGGGLKIFWKTYKINWFSAKYTIINAITYILIKKLIQYLIFVALNQDIMVSLPYTYRKLGQRWILGWEKEEARNKNNKNKSKVQNNFYLNVVFTGSALGEGNEYLTTLDGQNLGKF